VPAAAVIPAPIAYILVVAVKKLVVEFLVGECSPTLGLVLALSGHPWVEPVWH
jgi:Na+-translocating ferredoxin:NAD+ oxidoreductase RnfA subunit